MEISLPTTLRGNHKHRKLKLGIDLPAGFYWDLKSIDSNLFLVYHPYKVIYEAVMNQYTGSSEDPRLNIYFDQGLNEEIWGYPLKQDNSDDPIPEHKWHIYHLIWPHGFLHTASVESKDPNYLRALVRRLNFQARIADKYSPREYNKMSFKQRQELDEKRQKEQAELFGLIQDENKWLMKSAMDEMSRGNINPTNPTKDVIMSGPWGNRSKVERPLTDKEAGIVGFD